MTPSLYFNSLALLSLFIGITVGLAPTYSICKPTLPFLKVLVLSMVSVVGNGMGCYSLVSQFQFNSPLDGVATLVTFFGNICMGICIIRVSIKWMDRKPYRALNSLGLEVNTK